MLRNILTLLGLLTISSSAHAFCGFYVARAESSLFNKASQVVLVRDEQRTVMTMASDFRGDTRDFAVVIPVPTFIERGQIHVASRSLVKHLDAYTAPRLVEYFDENPCTVLRRMELAFAVEPAPTADQAAQRAKSLGVKIEAEYTVGEYDILILSAAQSGGLTVWLQENGYRLPDNAEPVIGSYLKQGMKFFVAKVNLQKQQDLGYSYLRPLQVAYESPKFMLPIRLGTLNADGEQELYVYALTRKGRVETTNYRTVKIPSGMDLPVFIKDEFATFYQDMFAHQVRLHEGRAVFMEYAWNMAWCDPCAADPLSSDELRELGVMWLKKPVGQQPKPLAIVPPLPGRPIIPPGRAVETFVTRLHLRYDAEHFPEDLRLQVTADHSNFQGRYVIRHPWDGSDDCEAAVSYREEKLPQRRKQAFETLIRLTGWDANEVRQRTGMPDRKDRESSDNNAWWDDLWPDNG